MCPWWSLCTLYLHACQVRVTVGDSGLCCPCVTYFKCWLTPLWVDSAWFWALFCFRFLIQKSNSHTQKGIDGYSDGDMENTERISTNLSDSNNMRIKKKIKCACKKVQNSKNNQFFYIYINRTSRSIISVNSAFTESTKLPCQTASCRKLIAVKDLASTLQPTSSGQHPDPQWLAGALWSMSCSRCFLFDPWWLARVLWPMSLWPTSCSRCFLFDPWWPARVLWPMSTGQHPLTHNDWLVHFGPCHGAGAVTNGRWPEQVDPSLSTSKCTLTRLTLTHTLGPFHR